MIVLLAIQALFRQSGWVGSTQLHTLMEGIATLLALIIASMALVRYYTKKDRLFLFIGAGFFGTAFLDGYHTLVTSTFFEEYMPSDQPSLIPWSWIASRVYLSAFMLLSWLVLYGKNKLWQTLFGQDKIIYGFAGIFTLASFMFFVMVPLPPAYYPDIVFHRPEEFVPALLFLAALAGHVRHGGWRTNEFEHWLVLSLIIGFTSQVAFMSFSGRLFDFNFDTAHLLKKVSYLCVLIGLMISMFVIFRREEEIQNQLRLKTYNLKLANMDLEQFNYAVSHDLKAPLRAIHNYADFLQEDLQDGLEPEQKQYLAQLGVAVKQSERLIEDLLQLSRVGRIETGELDRVELDLFLKELIDSLVLAENESVKIEGTWPTLAVQRTFLHQIFQNIISNGLKFNQSEQKSVHLQCVSNEDARLTIRIKDNGIGIDEKYFDKVFEVFQRLHSETEYEGTGIGLAIVKKSLNVLGGSIRLESELNAGTSVYITLNKN